MYNQPPPNLSQGIALMQAGRSAEALTYLRIAARTEPLTAEGWLWLAAASDDLEEYRLCVEQALRLDPYHPIARRMMADLERVEEAGRGVLPGAYPPARPAPVRARPRRALRWMIVLLLALIGVGVPAVLYTSGVLESALDRWFAGETQAHGLEFTIGENAVGYRFYVEVPPTWMPANDDSPSWRDKREELSRAFVGADDRLGEISASFSRTVRNPVYGDLRPGPISIIETDLAALRRDGVIPALTLLEIVPLPDGDTVDVCVRIGTLQQELDGGAASGEVINAAVAERGNRSDCVYVLHRRLADVPEAVTPLVIAPDGAPPAIREILIAVPIETQDRYALWRLTLADSAYDDYRAAVDRIIGSLDYVSD